MVRGEWGSGGVGEWGSGGGCVAVTAIHSPNGAQDDSPRQLAWVTRAKEFTSPVRAAPHATMPLLTEEDWVTRFYHEVAPTALADTSAPDRLGISQRDKIIQPGITRELATPGTLHALRLVLRTQPRSAK